MLLVGNPALPLKGFDVALAALSAVNRVLPLRVRGLLLPWSLFGRIRSTCCTGRQHALVYDGGPAKDWVCDCQLADGRTLGYHR